MNFSPTGLDLEILLSYEQEKGKPNETYKGFIVGFTENDGDLEPVYVVEQKLEKGEFVPVTDEEDGWLVTPKTDAANLENYTIIRVSK